MFKIIILFLILSSCSLVQSPFIPAINNPEQAMEWAHNAITYDKNYGRKWISPDKIIHNGKGVCLQYATLMHDGLNRGGVANTICWAKCQGGGHFIVKCNNRYYDPTYKWGEGNQDEIKEFCDLSTIYEYDEITYNYNILSEKNNNY